MTLTDPDWAITRIIDVANELQRTGQTDATNKERIAAAFALSNPAFLPPEYPNLIEAWVFLDDWEDYAITVRTKYGNQINQY